MVYRYKSLMDLPQNSTWYAQGENNYTGPSIDGVHILSDSVILCVNHKSYAIVAGNRAKLMAFEMTTSSALIYFILFGPFMFILPMEQFPIHLVVEPTQECTWCQSVFTEETQAKSQLYWFHGLAPKSNFYSYRLRQNSFGYFLFDYVVCWGWDWVSERDRMVWGCGFG